MSQHLKGEQGKEYWKTKIKQSEEGKFQEIKEEDPKLYFHHLRTIQYHRTNAAIKPKGLRGGDTPNAWLWGPPGTGKTLGAEIMYREHYKKDPTNKWWDGYNDEEVVIMDDLDVVDAQKYMGKYIKIWCHNKPFSAECKGGNTRMIRPKRIIVTCNWKPDDIWQDPNMLIAINRRFEVIEVDGKELEKHIEMEKEWECRQDYNEVMKEIQARCRDRSSKVTLTH